MSDVDRTLGAMRPALPSRATGEQKPLTLLPAEEPTKETVVERQTRKFVCKGKKKKTARTITREAETWRKEHTPPIPSRKEASRNRPKEMKTRLNAVLEAMATMSKLEGAVFTTTMQRLEELTGPARRRIIDGLMKVYL